MSQINVASCWICLEEGPDDSGQPLRRDCSCRGSDSGYGHVSCIIKYAKEKSMVSNSSEPWSTCPNCNQKYQHDLAFDLADAALSYIEQRCPRNSKERMECDVLTVDSLLIKIEAIQTNNNCKTDPSLRAEGKRNATKLLSLVDKVKSRDNRNYAGMLEECQAKTHMAMADFHSMDKTEDGYREAIKYYKILRDMYVKYKDKLGVSQTDAAIAQTISMIAGGGKIEDRQLKQYRSIYEQTVQKSGEGAIDALSNGINLAGALKKSNHSIEAERLASKSVIISRRVYGPEHDFTKKAENLLNYIKEDRMLVLKSWSLRGRHGNFYALRYVDDGKGCLVQGPIAQPSRCQDKEKTFTVPTNDIIPHWGGTPVVCHGLKKAVHLNGKIGDTRSYNQETGRLGVQFEDKRLGKKPFAIKPENLRILFELPDVEE